MLNTKDQEDIQESLDIASRAIIQAFNVMEMYDFMAPQQQLMLMVQREVVRTSSWVGLQESVE